MPPSPAGRWLLFLHADTRLHERWFDALRQAESRRAVGGAFRFTLDSPRPAARLIERGVAWRTRWLGLPYGDQGLFVRRDAFEALEGYRPYPLMEDVDLVRRLRRRGSLLLSPLPVRTSARRWERDGWMRRSVRNLALVALYFAGVPPHRLARSYYASSIPSAPSTPSASAAPSGPSPPSAPSAPSAPSSSPPRARPRWLAWRSRGGRADAA